MRIGRAFLLAAGYGTRLRPLSLRLPKPAWPLMNQPIAAHAARSLVNAGVDDFIINLHHLKHEMTRAMEASRPAGARFRYSPEEPAILGTGGALAPWLTELRGETFFLANADTYRNFDHSAMADFHFACGADATLSLMPLPPGEQGPIETDSSGRIVRFLDARSPGSGRGTACHGFSGLHVLGPQVMDIVSEVSLSKKTFCINADVHRALLARGGRLYGYRPPPASTASDLGTPYSYLECHIAMLEAGPPPDWCPGQYFAEDEELPGGGKVLAPSFLGPGAKVGKGASTGPFSVLGERAEVFTGVRVSRSVVFADSQVKSDAGGAIVSPWGERMEV